MVMMGESRRRPNPPRPVLIATAVDLKLLSSASSDRPEALLAQLGAEPGLCNDYRSF